MHDLLPIQQMAFSFSITTLSASAVVLVLSIHISETSKISDVCKAAKDEAHAEQVAAWNDPSKTKKTYAVKLRCEKDDKAIKTCHPQLLPNNDGVEALSAAVLQDAALPNEQGLVMTCLPDELPYFTLKDLGFAKSVCGKPDGEKKASVKAVKKSILPAKEFDDVEFKCESNTITDCKPQDAWNPTGRSYWIKPSGTISGYLLNCHKFAEPTIIKLESAPTGATKDRMRERPIKPRDLLV